MPGAAPRPGIRVGFISLGCAKNLVDSQVMAGVLVSEGLVLAPSPEQADVMVVNTCAFIQDAREESIDAILDACALKQTGACRAVVVAGCLPQRYRAALREALPEVDAWAGLDSLESVGRIVRRAARGEKVVAVPSEAVRLFEPRAPGLVFTGGPHAYLKIAEGCDHPCAFCAIPAIRGRHRSRPPDAIVREAEALLEAGFRELNLVSQDTTSYGRDRDDGASLPRLLPRLAALGEGFRIRVLYAYPSRVDRALLETMAGLPSVCRYLDVPIQHSHPQMLRAMRRADTVPAVRQLPAQAREVMPDITLRTTLLTGFPGETRRHSDHLAAYLETAAYDHVGVFAFSPEEGTPALSMRPRPRAATAARRRDRLLALQQHIVARQQAALVGRRAVALLERKEGRRWVARTARQAPGVDGVTYVTGVPREAGVGAMLPVRYTAAAGYDMVAGVVTGDG